MVNPIIICQDLSHTYSGEVEALRNINLSIEQGDVLGIVGQNGSGKTTLVKHFNAMLKPTKGKVFVNKEDTAAKPVHEMSRTVGYVFQNPNHQLFASSVEKELAFGPSNLGLPDEIIQARVESALRLFDLENVRTIHPYRLTFPLRKLVCIASMYALQPEVYVLDEPTTGQDHAGVNRIKDVVEKISSEGRTVIIVSHDMPLVAEIAHRMVVLWEGSIIADAHPREVFSNQDVLQRSQLSPPQITQLAIRVARENPHQQLPPIALSINEYVEAFEKINGGTPYVE
jgi:energy-coupling factor transport system ATP-binding protein